MRKSTIVESGIVIASGAIAAHLGYQLADHNVPTAAIVATIAFTLTGGLAFASDIAKSVRTTLYTCPAKGCTVSIRAAGTTEDELNRLRVLATDHSKHGSTT
ncbi:hypothetical protein [Streptomyces sp. ME19-01-6]|uniref:hypothetical protein n=1 Tax=Streptomyces sp. ME19-01-6 TaxID=3028686 RepID=UPI0029B5019A|nr:hypothetical protein [Streptomyces sp. ME19-01-6]MDX3232866.1 hypothetical protein [Streptomyces sp. ME19-01-6]